jgi:hypothetical protein
MKCSLCQVFRACERLRSKPMWTLTHPENRPCGYAVGMLRITIHETLQSKRRGLVRALEVDSSALLQPRYIYRATLLP